MNEDMLNNPELIKLQENIFKKIHDLEVKFTENIKENYTVNDKKVMNLEVSIDTLNARIFDLSSSMNSSKNLIEKIPELSKNYSLLSEDIFTHNVKMLNFQKELTSATNKYDKIYMENLVLPGIIGNGCRYKSLREYIDVNNII